MLSRIVHQMWALHDEGGDQPRCHYCGCPCRLTTTPAGEACYQCDVCGWTVARVVRADVWPSLFGHEDSAVDALMRMTGCSYSLAVASLADCCGAR